MSDDSLPEADRTGTAPHPRETSVLTGHAQAERQFLDAVSSNRMHHAWLLSGPRGIGKATLAWKVARFLLSHHPAAADEGLFGDAPSLPAVLDTPDDTTLAARMRALSEPSLMLIRRAWDVDKKRLKAQITVDDVRKLGGFFSMSSADGGRRVVVVDSVDDMNPSAANALLKVLEEPPRHAVLLLISHAPARLLPTITSRCREIRMTTLAPSEVESTLQTLDLPDADIAALARLSGGSVGDAVRFHEQDGPKLYDDLLKLVATSPNMDRSQALRLADFVGARGATDRLQVFLQLADTLVARLARTGVGAVLSDNGQPEEQSILKRLAPNPASGRRWAEVHAEATSRIAHGLAVNVDPSTLILDFLLQLDQAARP